MSKKILLIFSIISLVIIDIKAQEITNDKFKFNLISEDFLKKQDNFPIVRETENYFILDENAYLIIRENNVSDYEMLKTFNCGVGFCLIAKSQNISKIQKKFQNKYKPYVIGKISSGKKKVQLNEKIFW